MLEFCVSVQYMVINGTDLGQTQGKAHGVAYWSLTWYSLFLFSVLFPNNNHNLFPNGRFSICLSHSKVRSEGIQSLAYGHFSMTDACSNKSLPTERRSQLNATPLSYRSVCCGDGNIILTCGIIHKTSIDACKGLISAIAAASSTRIHRNNSISIQLEQMG